MQGGQIVANHAGDPADCFIDAVDDKIAAEENQIGICERIETHIRTFADRPQRFAQHRRRPGLLVYPAVAQHLQPYGEHACVLRRSCAQMLRQLRRAGKG
ncbi:hypothetical protein [Defluviicoccus vanus]|uniref:Uncharacterized protein n=1 Tax=Defluviicoccus vanus TaxID=111831 RepID=A0A7H1N439_9PROT|nr:hypothetical protein [Defluviicoccus vanus]QNT70475.1 hypothetical protein HQ394_15490 [Defluviicoccus vanus]